MKAFVNRGKNRVAVEEVSDPKIEAPGDAIIRITTAARAHHKPLRRTMTESRKWRES